MSHRTVPCIHSCVMTDRGQPGSVFIILFYLVLPYAYGPPSIHFFVSRLCCRLQYLYLYHVDFVACHAAYASSFRPSQFVCWRAAFGVSGGAGTRPWLRCLLARWISRVGKTPCGLAIVPVPKRPIVSSSTCAFRHSRLLHQRATLTVVNHHLQKDAEDRS